MFIRIVKYSIFASIRTFGIWSPEVNNVFGMLAMPLTGWHCGMHAAKGRLHRHFLGVCAACRHAHGYAKTSQHIRTAACESKWKSSAPICMCQVSALMLPWDESDLTIAAVLFCVKLANQVQQHKHEGELTRDRLTGVPLSDAWRGQELGVGRTVHKPSRYLWSHCLISTAALQCNHN